MKNILIVLSLVFGISVSSFASSVHVVERIDNDKRHSDYTSDYGHLARYLNALSSELDTGTSGYYDHFARAYRVRGASSFREVVDSVAATIAKEFKRKKEDVSVDVSTPNEFTKEEFSFFNVSENRPSDIGLAVLKTVFKRLNKDVKGKERADENFETRAANFEVDPCAGWLTNAYDSVTTVSYTHLTLPTSG